MMKRQYYFLLFLPIFLFSCGSANNSVKNTAEYRQMLEKVQKLDFRIENNWANPVRYSSVNLIGNPNHITFEEDSVAVYLPFFGERQFSGGYGSAGAIEYKGNLKDLKIEEIPENNEVQISFQGNKGSENLNFRVIVFPNGNTNTSVTSSQRDHMSYNGKIVRKELE
ncbi:DUF4251 domain-containing protein [Salinimicrobium sp. WS361]|uniref:DUF4251 domain-containing protein n=1 Tax=Salinimicrobium sp. WS361 TaxID=3425123 RepID=UPI003D6FE7A4